MKTAIQFRVRLYREDEIALGPGKVRLLEAIAESGSISGAARDLGMSYRRAWQLVEQMNRCLIDPAVVTAKGGTNGGGAGLTTTGQTIVATYRALEAAARKAATPQIETLTRLLAR